MALQQSIGQVERICELSSQLFSPFEMEESLFICAQNGEIFKIQNGQVKSEYNFGGNPTSIVIDSRERTIFIADMTAKAISVRSLDKPQDPPELLREYEGSSFIGPNSMVLSKQNNCLYFTDSGPFGETTFDQNNGSVFMIDLELSLVRPLAHNCLSYPSGLAISKNEQIIYVSETSKNRIIRFVLSPQGIYYFSNFMQFQGRFGPMALSVSQSDLLFVVRYELQSMARDGMISIINHQNAQILGNVMVPFQPELSGLLISKKQNNMMYATDNSKFPCFIRIVFQSPESEEEKHS